MATDEKKEKIITAALRRFAKEGVAKARMTDIAADLSISKPLLYYYFPDKRNLFAAVVGHLITEAKTRLDALIDLEADPIKAILVFLDFRADFVQRYYNILSYLKTYAPEDLPENLKGIFGKLGRQHIERITGIIQKGVDTGMYKNIEPRKMAELYYEMLESVRFSKSTNQRFFLLDKKQTLEHIQREREFSVIFMHGLTFKR